MPETIASHRLPPGQALTRKFPLVGEKDFSAVPPLADWRLEIAGLIDPAFQLTWEQVMALPHRELVRDIHCVTGWSRFDMRFTGIPLAELLAAYGAKARPEARFVRFEAYSPRKHDTSLAVDVALADTWLFHSWEGAPLTPEHGGPLRTVTPSRYFYKGVKWVHRIEFLAEDRLGYWERDSDYHNNADPWPGDQRYTSGSHTPEEVEHFRYAASYVPYRGAKKTLLSVDLRGWAPTTRDLREIYLKNCDLRGARLAGADLRGANLTRCLFDGADLSGADVEGADFNGADLTGADFTGAALSAALFAGARVEGLRWSAGSEILEDQERYLRERNRG